VETSPESDAADILDGSTQPNHVPSPVPALLHTTTAQSSPTESCTPLILTVTHMHAACRGCRHVESKLTITGTSHHIITDHFFFGKRIESQERKTHMYASG
jgi:hypothetical protein